MEETTHHNRPVVLLPGIRQPSEENEQGGDTDSQDYCSHREENAPYHCHARGPRVHQPYGSTGHGHRDACTDEKHAPQTAPNSPWSDRWRGARRSTTCRRWSWAGERLRRCGSSHRRFGPCPAGALVLGWLRHNLTTDDPVTARRLLVPPEIACQRAQLGTDQAEFVVCRGQDVLKGTLIVRPLPRLCRLSPRCFRFVASPGHEGFEALTLSLCLSLLLLSPHDARLRVPQFLLHLSKCFTTALGARTSRLQRQLGAFLSKMLHGQRQRLDDELSVSLGTFGSDAETDLTGTAQTCRHTHVQVEVGHGLIADCLVYAAIVGCRSDQVDLTSHGVR